jgi:hypothetical protein
MTAAVTYAMGKIVAIAYKIQGVRRPSNVFYPLLDAIGT